MENENNDTASEVSVYMDTEAFNEVLATVRSRKQKEKPKKENTKTSLNETENKKRARKEEVPQIPEPEPPKEEDKEEKELTEEEKNALRITTKIKERMKVRREQRREAKKEERRRKMEEWAKWHVPRDNTSRSTISSSSAQTEERRRSRALKRQQLPFSVVCSQLKDFMETEKALQDDFLQTIRMLRGNDESKDKEESSKMEEEPTEIVDSPVAPQSPENEPETHMEEEQKDSVTPVEDNPVEILPESEPEQEQEQSHSPTAASPLLVVHSDQLDEPEKKPRKKRRIKSKVDHRWPKGHSHFTRPADDNMKMGLVTSVEMAYILEESTAGTPVVSNANLHKPFHHYCKNRRRDQLEFEQWREEMMKIAYDKEFSRGKDKMFYWVPLPDIASNVRRGTSISSRNNLSTSNTSHSFYMNDRNELLNTHSDKSLTPYIQNGAISPYFNREVQLNSRSRTSNKMEINENVTQDFGMYDTRRFKKHQHSNHNKNQQENLKQNDDIELKFKSNNSNSNNETENTENSKNETVSRESTDSAINMPSIHSSEASVNTPEPAGQTTEISIKGDNYQTYSNNIQESNHVQGSHDNAQVLIQA